MKEILESVEVNQKNMRRNRARNRFKQRNKSNKIRSNELNNNEFYRHINSHPINEKLETVEIMSAWIKKARVFRSNDRNSKQQI